MNDPTPTAQPTFTIEQALEQMVDAHGLHAVTTALSGLCYSKSQHIAENWPGSDGTETQARDWHKAGNKLGIAALYIKIQCKGTK